MGKKTAKVWANVFPCFSNIRTLAAEAINYPIMICSIIHFVVEKNYAHANFSFVAFILSAVRVFFQVFIIRFLVMVVAVASLNKQT